MLRLLLLSVLTLTVHSAPGNLPTVLSPFTITPSVEILKTPVTKLETISYATPTITKTLSAPAAIVTPVVQKIDSYSAGGDSSSYEIRDLLRSLLNEIRGGKTVTTLSTPLATYSAPAVLDSYAAPPRNTVTDYNAPTYPDSKKHHHKPEKVVLVQEKEVAPVALTSYVEAAPVAVKEVVKTVYQPVYVPVQYAQPQPQYLTVSQPVAVPTTVKTGASAVAFSTIHGSPALAIQQQQVAVPLVQQYAVQQPVAAVATASAGAILDSSASYSYKK